MQTISATEAKNHLASVMNASVHEPVIIEKNGKPYVVMMSVEAFREYANSGRKESFIRLCDEMAATAKQGGMTEEILHSILHDR